MDKIIISHPGTEYYNTLANRIQTMIEVDFGFDVEQVVGEIDGKLSLFTDDGVDILETTKMPDSSALRLYISLAT